MNITLCISYTNIRRYLKTSFIEIFKKQGLRNRLFYSKIFIITVTLYKLTPCASFGFTLQTTPATR